MKLDFGGNKLLYHLDRVAAWQRGEIVTPIIYEISLTDACNSRCKMCHFEMLGRRNRYFPDKVLESLPEQLAEAGTKSYFLAGEGEPLLHPGAAKFCAECAARGVEGSLSSNGIAFAGETAEILLNTMTWIRFTVLSFDSGHYGKLATGGRDYSDTIRKNIEQACRLREKHGLPVAIGIQQILFDGNVEDIVPQCRIARELGVDYFIIVPGIKGFGDMEPPIMYRGSHQTYSGLVDECRKLSTDSFHVSPEDRLTQKAKTYNRCLGFPFVSRIYSDAKVYPCLRYRDDAEKALGDLSQSSLMEIWHSKRAQGILKELSTESSFQNCQWACRANMTNKFLFALTMPPPHVNFI